MNCFTVFCKLYKYNNLNFENISLCAPKVEERTVGMR